MINYDADLQLISSKLWCCCLLKTILSFNLWELLAMCVFWGKNNKTQKFVFRHKQFNNINSSNPFIVYFWLGVACLLGGFGFINCAWDRGM